MAGKPTFIPPEIQDNPDGWGPCQIPKMFQDIPYQPFSKGDRLGKVSDWTGGMYQDRRYNSKYNSQFGAGGQMFSYFHEQDESSFHLVDTTKTQKPAYLRNRAKFNQRNLRRDRERREQRMNPNLQPLGKNKAGQRLQRKLQKQYGNRGHWQDRRQQNQPKHRNASVMVREEWKVVEEMDFPRLSKLSLPNIGEPEVLKECGEMQYYDKSYDRITTKSEKPLVGVNRTFHRVTTTDDPEIRKLLAEGNVFGTDAIIAALMTCTRSVYSWDIVVRRIGKKLFFDKRDDSGFDLLSVSETANDAPMEEGTGINSPTNLAIEATYVNQNFSQQVLKNDVYKFANENPFLTEDDEGELASVGYKYQKFDLGDDMHLIVRCEHDAVMVGANGEKSFVNIKTLNEWNPYASKTSKVSNVEWRQKLDSQRGAILATELKNNSCKLAKWTASSILASSEYLKLGFVSRKNYHDSTSHVILGTSQFRPKEFATQIALNMDNAWGILRCIIDTCMKLPEGKYLILKDPNKTVVRIYDIPENTFESSDDDDDDEEEEEEKDDEEER